MIRIREFADFQLQLNFGQRSSFMEVDENEQV